MHLQGAAGEPGAGALEGRPLNDREAEQVLIEGERPREIGDDEINMVERKLSHRATINAVAGEAIRQLRQETNHWTRVTGRLPSFDVSAPSPNKTITMHDDQLSRLDLHITRPDSRKQPFQPVARATSQARC